LILLNVCVGQFIVGLDQRALLVALLTLTTTFNQALRPSSGALIYDLMLTARFTVGRPAICLAAACFTPRIFALRRQLALAVFQSADFSRPAGGGRRHDRGQRPGGASALPSNQRAGDGFRRWLFIPVFTSDARRLPSPSAGAIFYLNLPIGLWGATLAWKLLEESRESGKEISVDFPGAILLMLTYSLFIYGMNELPHVGWRDPVVVKSLALAALACALFVVVELRARMPILSFSLFRDRLFTASMFSLFFITSTQSAISFLMPFYLQNVLHFSPTQMGWIIIANSVVIVMVAPIAGRLSDRAGSRLLCTIGSALIVVGQFFLASLGTASSIPRIIFPLVLNGSATLSTRRIKARSWRRPARLSGRHRA
jgi:hypothetical protein